MTTTVYINNVLRDDVRVNRIRASYVAPWEAELFYPGRHDAAISVRLWDSVLIEDDASVVRFRGHVTAVRPGGVAGEGITFICQDARFRLENEPVRVNGRGSYVWNQRGSTCDLGKGGYDCPNRDGMHWTCGQIIVDILEHALGVPSGGSGIPGHHTSPCCVPDPYLTSADVAGYAASDILALDSICGEFSVDNTPVAQAISLLLGLNGGFYGWYLDPATGYLVVVDMDSLPATDVQAGQLGQWQDRAGTDYRLLDNQLEWSLDGVCSTIVIQGQDATSEEEPDNIEGSANPGNGNLGRLEMVAAPWLSWPAAYRAVCQPTRLATDKLIDMPTPIVDPDTGITIGVTGGNEFTPPAGYGGFSYLPRVYVGTVGGPKRIYEPSSGAEPVWVLVSGVVAFYEDPRGVMGPYEKLWGWYFASVPFTVSAGPDGDAYDCFGYECTRTVYDASMRDVTSYPMAAFSNADKLAMGVLAQRLLRQYCNVRRQGTLSLDRADFGTGLGARYNVVNLTAPAGGLPCGAGPMDWASLAINAVEVTWNFAEATTQVRVANTFFMLEEYSALKVALEQQLFVRREVNLSQTIYDCQVRAPSAHDPTTHAPFGTTAWPVTPPPTQPPPTPTPTAPPTGGGTPTPPPTGGPTPTPTAGPTPTPTPGGGGGPTPTPTPGDGTTPGGSTAGPTPTPTPGDGTTPGPTTPGPTTPGGTTPAPATGCPMECSEPTCNDSYSFDVPDHLCGNAPLGGTVTVTGGGGCMWSSGPNGAYTGTLHCDSGWWYLQVMGAGLLGGLCTYRMRANGQGDCPDGTYDLTSGCDDEVHYCPPTMSVYNL